MYAAPELIELGSFQELTLGAGMHTGLIGPVGSLVNSTLSDINHTVDGLIHQLPGVGVTDNSHIGTDKIVIDPTITITPR